jgi:hypothetical protein
VVTGVLAGALVYRGRYTLYADLAWLMGLLEGQWQRSRRPSAHMRTGPRAFGLCGLHRGDILGIAAIAAWVSSARFLACSQAV